MCLETPGCMGEAPIINPSMFIPILQPPAHFSKESHHVPGKELEKYQHEGFHIRRCSIGASFCTAFDFIRWSWRFCLSSRRQSRQFTSSHCWICLHLIFKLGRQRQICRFWISLHLIFKLRQKICCINIVNATARLFYRGRRCHGRGRRCSEEYAGRRTEGKDWQFGC